MTASTGKIPSVLLRPVRRADFPMLKAWLAEPHVRRWWGEPAAEIAMISELLDDPAATCWIASDAEGVDFGYCQGYAVDRGDPRSRAAWACLKPGAVGLDCLIGRADRLGRGLGAGIVAAALADYAARPPDPAHAYVFMDPDPANATAIRAYTRAGLTPAGRLTMPEGTVFLLTSQICSLQTLVNHIVLIPSAVIIG